MRDSFERTGQDVPGVDRGERMTNAVQDNFPAVVRDEREAKPAALLAAPRLALVKGREAEPRSNLSDAPSVSAFEQLAFQYGRSYDSYLSTDPACETFWNHECTAALAYWRLGRAVFVQGGLLGPDEARGGLLAEFLEQAKERRWVVTLFNAGQEDLPLLRATGFQVTKWGEEPLIDLDGLTWSGREFEWVRRQRNFCLRQEMYVEECCREDYSDTGWEQLRGELRRVAAEGLRSKPQRGEIRFFNGRFDAEPWHRRRLFVARSRGCGSNAIAGFLVCLPYRGGTEWAIDTYRQSNSAPRGLVPFMMQQVLDQFREEGVARVSLCLCPALRCETLPGDNSWLRRGLEFGYGRAASVFSLAGEYHFKSRFRPQFAPRYFAQWPHGSLWSLARLVMAAGVFDLSPGKILREFGRRLREGSRTQPLAVPMPTVAPAVAKGVTGPRLALATIEGQDNGA